LHTAEKTAACESGEEEVSEKDVHPVPLLALQTSLGKDNKYQDIVSIKD